MENLIKIEDSTTYPKKLLSFFEEEKEILYNSSTCLYKHIAEMLNEEYFYSLHASRLIDANSIITNGIIVPSNSNLLLEQFLSNIRDEFDKTELKDIKKKLYLKQQEYGVDPKFKKYNKIWFILGNIDDISITNGLYMLEKYGGELLEEFFIDIDKKDLYFEKIAKKGKAYAIEFKVKFSKINHYKQEKIINRILEKYLFNTKADYPFMEAYTTENIAKEQIITITSINIEEK